ncbi:MAG: glutamine--tRNA ligase/YqeY domain fusion protein [Bacteroidota bacterium]|nr:glutamine--tRNA ligase/YqeY domain fusion protein [Bacteroidota bacterium]MEE3149021.1 glutamine--tRNA ligase/YqeY domain fusion protein [Bacteroidota bacterium]
MAEDYVALNFLEQIVEEDITNGFPKDDLRFRFPPEPNGYLHIGHCKAICISFGLGEKYNAPVNLRFDDTNPSKEEQEYVDAIQEDIKWLGFKWDKVCYSSDYFQQLYDWAIQLIKDGKAYIDSQSSEAMAEQKGTPTEPGTNSPYRERSVEENLELFEKMAKGEFAEGVHVLRAKIDMQSPNMLLRDPIMYRVINKAHHRTGNTWNIYPMYDWAHGESDYVEQVSHSLCSLEFKPHRPLYEWFVDNVYTNGIKPKQREFARLNLSYTIMSKRKLLKLVQEGIVSGWDDPRMPTISGIRRRGYTPAAIRNFIDAVGVAKRDNVIDVSLLEFNVREDLNKTAPRVMAVLDPVKLVITNYPEDQEEWLEAENNQEDENAGYRKVPFSKELYIEKDDFKENANSKYFRLTLGKEVRLKNAYIIKGESVVKDANGNITEIHCTYDADSRSGSGTEASLRKVKGTLHWVSIKHAIKAEVRLYDRLFNHESPDGDKEVDFMEHLNPNSLETITGYLEPSLSEVEPMDIFQFQRLGYFNVDKDSTAEHLVFNKTVGLRDTWAKVESKSTKQEQPKAAPKKQIPQIPALNEIKKVGKKLAQIPDEKRVKAIARIRELAKDVDYEELKELFNTSAKKIGTRLAVLETLIVLIQLNKVDQKNEEVAAYLEEMKTSGNELLENSVNNL